MSQHFTEADFANMTQIRIEGEQFGDRLTNSINFITDFFGFGIKRGMESVQEIVDFVSPSQRDNTRLSADPRDRTRTANPSDDPVFMQDNTEEEF